MDTTLSKSYLPSSEGTSSFLIHNVDALNEGLRLAKVALRVVGLRRTDQGSGHRSVRLPLIALLAASPRGAHIAAMIAEG